jgi:hypothetical protein
MKQAPSRPATSIQFNKHIPFEFLEQVIVKLLVVLLSLALGFDAFAVDQFAPIELLIQRNITEATAAALIGTDVCDVKQGELLFHGIVELVEIVNVQSRCFSAKANKRRLGTTGNVKNEAHGKSLRHV